MTKTLPRLIGLANAATGIALVALGFMLPSSRLVEAWASRVHAAVGTTTEQVRLVRVSLNDLNAAEVSTAANAIAVVTEHAAGLAQRTSIDFEVVERASDAMAGVAAALESLDPVLNAAYLEKVRGELQAVATLLDERAAPAAKTTSETLATLASQAEQQAKAFSEAINAANLHAGTVAAVSTALEEFAGAIEDSKGSIATVREELPGFVKNLGNIASRCRRYRDTWLAWGAGSDVKKGLAEAADVLDDAAAALAGLNNTLLPSVTRAMDNSHGLMEKIAAGGKQLGAHKDEIDTLLKDGPELLASLGAEIGKFGRRLSDIMAETGRITAVADALRASAAQLKEAESALPAARKAVAGSAVAIRATQQKMAALTRNREALDDLGPRTGHALEVAAKALERANEGLVSRLNRQKAILQQVEANCEDMQALLPAVGSAATRILLALKVLAWICGITLGAHGLRAFL